MRAPKGTNWIERDGVNQLESEPVYTTHWWGRGLASELGVRAFGCMIMASRQGEPNVEKQ